MELCGLEEPPRVPKRPELPNRPEPWRTPNRSEAFRTVPNRPDEPSPVPNRPEPPRDGSGNVQRFWTVRDGSGWGRFGTHGPVRNGSGASAQPAQPAHVGLSKPRRREPKQSRACSLALAVLRKLARTESVAVFSILQAQWTTPVWAPVEPKFCWAKLGILTEPPSSLRLLRFLILWLVNLGFRFKMFSTCLCLCYPRWPLRVTAYCHSLKPEQPAASLRFPH